MEKIGTIEESVLDLLETLQEASIQIFEYASLCDSQSFLSLTDDMDVVLNTILSIQKASSSQLLNGYKTLELSCRSIKVSLYRIRQYYQSNRAKCAAKIEFELLPLIQEAYLRFYVQGYVAATGKGLEDYYRTAMSALSCNQYIDEAMMLGSYKYELSITVRAYNKLEYTKRCVESILKNIPDGLKYELILVDHGSTDGTREYFESLHPTKQLDIARNGGGAGAIARIVEGEFSLQVSNDVVVTPNTIQNLLTCIRSDPQIAWAVPSTPNISNLQTIPASYKTEEEFLAFARNNNCSDQNRWEQRVRLCNPIDIRRNSVFYASKGLCLNGYYHSTSTESFPDDRTSLLLRRNGYKLMLAKDAYCHHFGSVTLKNEIQKQNEQNYYLEGRKEFYRAFGVDPWGSGFCFDPVFFNRVVKDEPGHVEILGINCGLGSNSLKLKEQIKEYCHNTDVTLTNITDVSAFMEDLAGISDNAYLVNQMKDLNTFFSDKKFKYIIWEEKFLCKYNGRLLLGLCLQHLCGDGIFFVKKNDQLKTTLEMEKGWTPIGDNWFKYELK